ncbi:hypothetical protein ABPG72_001924 [Tetrahymena utriculariae]
MFDKKKFSLPTVLQAEEAKTHSIYTPKQEPQKKQQQFQHSFQYIKEHHPATSRNKEKSVSSKQFNFTEYDIVSGKNPNVYSEKTRNYIKNQTKLNNNNSSTNQILPQLSICQDNGTIKSKKEDKDQQKDSLIAEDICNIVEIKNQLKQLENGECSSASQNLKSPNVRVNKLESLFFMREGQNQQKIPQQSSLLDQYFVLKNGSTLQSQNSFEKSFLNQSTNNFKSSETNQIFRGSKFSIEEDSKNNFHQTNPNQTKYVKQIKQHSDILRHLSQEKYMKSPIFTKQGEDISNIIKQSRDHSNSIHLAMKSFQIEKGKKLFQFEKELMKIKENIMSKTYFNFPSRSIHTKSINDSLISQINQMNIFEEEKKQDLNMSQLNSPPAAGSIQIFQNTKQPQQNQFQEQESKLNQTIIKFITDKSILQEDFVKQVLNQESKEEQQNTALHFLRKRQMHFTQNPEVVDLLEQIDIHHKTLKNLGNQYQNNHLDFFKEANLDTIKKDILIYQKSFVQKPDYKICQEREESKHLQDWLRVMIDKVLKKSNNSFQQMFSELELIFHGCMQELVRQICIQCQERGDILCQIWNQYNYLISKLFSMHSVMNSRQNQKEYDRLKFLTQMIDKKQQEFMEQIKKVQQRLDEEFENNQKVNDQNVYLRKKLNKIENEKNDLTCQFSSVQQEFSELQTHHQHILGKFTELEEQLNDNLLQSLNKATALTNTLNASNTQNEQFNQDLINISQKLLQLQQDKLVSQKFIQQQQSKLYISSQKSKVLTFKQIPENANYQNIEEEEKKTINSAVSLENEIFVKNQEQKTKIEIEGINNVGINTSFKFFLDRVDVCVNTTSTFENKIYTNQEVQTDKLEKGYEYSDSKKQIKGRDIFSDLDYDEVVNKLNNHLLEMKSTLKEKINPEVYYQKLKDLKLDLLNTFKKKRVSIQEIKNKAVHIQDQQQNIFKDVLQQLLESNSTVLEQKIIIAEKDIKIQGLEEQINSQQLKIDILKHTYIENQLNDSSQNSENLDQISFEQIIESSHLISINPKPNRSSNQIQLSTFRNIAERDSLQKDAKRKDIEQEFYLYQQNNSINFPTQEAIKEQAQDETQIDKELEPKVHQQGEDSSVQNNDATSLSNTNNFSNHELSSTSIKKIERQISNKRQSDTTKKSKQISYLKNNKSSDRKFSIQLINTNRSIPNSPNYAQTMHKQNSNFKKPSISHQLNQAKSQKRDQFISPKRKQVQAKKQITKGQPLLTKERATILANKEAAELILETAKVVLVQNTDYKQMNQIVKIINIIYNECLKQYKKGESEGQQPIIYILYDWFLHRFGVKNIAEKKLLDFLVQIRKSDDNPKIHAFGKIVGLYKTEILQFYDLQFFIKCMSLFEEYSNQSKTANIQIEKLKINKQQITEASYFFFGSVISKQGIEEFIQSTLEQIILDIENFRNILVKNQIANQELNSTQDFDIDIISEKFLSLHIQLEEAHIQKYKGIFQIVQQANFIGLEEFLILIRNLNIKDLKEIEMVQMFKQKADQYNDCQLQMSLKRFCMVCQENKTLFEKDQKDFLKFSLQSNNINLIENKIHNVQEIKNNWELLSIIIKTRFIYSKSYKTVYQNMFDQMQSFFQEQQQQQDGDESQLKQKQEQGNRIMLIFRILCEESRRNIINYETDQIFGEPFSTFTQSIRQQIHKIV